MSSYDMANYDFSVDPENLFARTDKVMELRVFVDSNDSEFIEIYRSAILQHNTNIFFNPFYDAGFDLLCPDNYKCLGGCVTKINFQVKSCARIISENGQCVYTGFYMYPRSSLSKTFLRLANSVGVIDSGYRGDLIGAFDCGAGSGSGCSGNADACAGSGVVTCASISNYSVNKFDKLVQICAPNLIPIYVRMVSRLDDLSVPTIRGTGGFGSTGK
jgi:dUTP pyrophosphatase